MHEVMHNVKLNLADLPDWGTSIFMMKTNAGKLDNKGTEGCWLGYSSMSKGHHIYAPNWQITVECKISFEDMVLQVPSIPIAGEDKDNHIIKSSNLNTVVQQLKQPVKHQADIISHGTSVASGISADKSQVDEIIQNLENNQSDQPLKQSARLNPPPIQNPKLQPRRSEHLEQQVATGTEGLDTEIMLSMTSIANQIIDPLTVKAAKKLEDWPEWQVPLRTSSISTRGLELGNSSPHCRMSP